MWSRVKTMTRRHDCLIVSMSSPSQTNLMWIEKVLAVTPDDHECLFEVEKEMSAVMSIVSRLAIIAKTLSVQRAVLKFS